MSFVSNQRVLRTESTIWQQINIDDDLAPEYLLFFTYDNGQVGALIFDQQTGSASVTSPTPVPAPNQPVGAYISYRVEPNYWTRSDLTDTVGYVAPPGTPSAVITVTQVQRLPPDASNLAAGQSNPASVSNELIPLDNELILFGGPDVISVLWWRNAYNGYGITQMAASGGLVRPARQANNDERPLESVTGLEPETGVLGRSNLCREVRYVRENATEPIGVVLPVYQSPVKYVAQDRGIAFCQSPPSFPFYPEGVVLGYLRPENPNDTSQTEAARTAYREQLVWVNVDPAGRQAFLSLIDLDGPDKVGVPPMVVQELRTPATIPMPPDYRMPSGGPITTLACTQIAQTDGSAVRRLLFDLVHTPPTQIESGAIPVAVPDRLYIANITDVTDIIATCAVIVP